MVKFLVLQTVHKQHLLLRSEVSFEPCVLALVGRNKLSSVLSTTLSLTSSVNKSSGDDVFCELPVYYM